MALRADDPRLGLTEREWVELEDPPGHKFAIIRGELDVTPGATPEHGRALGELYVALRAELPEGLRIVIDVDWHLTSQARVTTAPRPDLMVIPIEGPVAPLLVVEVLSPSDHHRYRGTDLSRIGSKRLDYAQAGLQHYLQIDPTSMGTVAKRFELNGEQLEVVDMAVAGEVLVSHVPFPYRIEPSTL